MMEQLSFYFEATNKVLNQLNAMIASEREKRVALLNHDTKKTETLLQEQQAMVMKLEGLEKRRVASQNEAGFGGLTSTQILEKITIQEDKTPFSSLFADLHYAAEQLKELNAVSLDIAQTELRLLEQLAAIPTDDRHGLYQANGTKSHASHSGTSFEEKI